MNAANSPSTWMRNRGTLKRRPVYGSGRMKVGGHVISSDLDGGTIVVRNAISQGGLMHWQLRSRFTFEARDGRFRIIQTALERFNQGRWGPIGKWVGSQWQGAENAFKGTAAAVARCVVAPRQREDW